MTLFILFWMLFFAMYDASSVTALPLERPLYAVILVTVLLAPFARRGPLAVPPARQSAMALYLALVLVGLAPCVGQPIVYPQYIIGDLASLIMPAGFLLVAHRYPDLILGRRAHLVIGTGLLLSATLAYFVGASYYYRHEAPPLLLTALAWFGLFRSRGAMRLVFLAMLAWILWLGHFSGFRTSTVLFLLGGGLATLIMTRSRLGMMIGFIILLLTLTLAGFEFGSVLQDYLSQTRFRDLAVGVLDESVGTRLLEAEDALRTMSTEGSFVNYIIGSGHGASYRPLLTDIASNTTAEGRVHHIHIGPVMLLFRYGVIGVGLWLYFAQRIVRESIWVLGRGRTVASGPRILFTMTMALYLGDFMVRNSLVDPFFSYSVAGFLFTSRAPRDGSIQKVERAA